ncbi:hypothetical protein GCK32_004092 [Trichostrongylus colubriformis]|uniref:G protein-coupled receptor n=1 Tax=Trichostrongylus colubriformis TaxID=6319 RepID=A0AAN8IJJ9_TRICO
MSDHHTASESAEGGKLLYQVNVFGKESIPVKKVMEATFEEATHFYLIAGTILVIMNVVLLSFYVPFLMVLWNNEFRQVTAYRFLFAIGVADCIQLSIHVASSITVLCQFTAPFMIGKIVGAAMYSSYCYTMPMYIFLSLNHLVYVIFPAFASRLCTPIFIWAVLITAFIGFVVFFVLRCLPSINFIFDPVSIQWITPAQDYVISHILKDYSNIIIAVYVGLSVVVYIAIFLHIKTAVSFMIILTIIITVDDNQVSKLSRPPN